ncbi:MAG: diguanylate cyclase [Pseudonocardiaceae bacterium]
MAAPENRRIPDLDGNPPPAETAGPRGVAFIDQFAKGNSIPRARANPARWRLWRQPKPMIAFLIAAESLAVTGFVVGFAAADSPSRAGWLHFAILAIGATVHIQLTRRQEERRRNRIIAVHIDLTAVWVFPAAVVLPVPLLLLVVLVVRTQRWFTARRPLHKFVFSSISLAFAGVLAHATYLGLHPVGLSALTTGDSVREFAIIAAAGLVYMLVQIAYVGGILALGATTNPTVRNVLGSTQDNLLDAVTIALGAVTAILLVNMPVAVAIMALVTVVFNRLAELGQLQSDVRTDSKTGLFNMRGWTESAQRAFERAKRADDTLALLMIDFDHFKWINDTYGHPAGDDVLRRFGELLGEVTRPTDIVGRFGGEEFLVLLPGIGLDAASNTGERIRRTLAAARIVTTDKRGGEAVITSRTTSIGVAAYPDHGESLDTLVQAADNAVYEAKEHGRDQVRLARRSRREHTETQ